MTRYRVTFSGMTMLAVAVSAALDANAQKAGSTSTARMLNSSGGVMQSCSNYTLTIDPNGSLDVSCLGPTPAPTPAPTPTPTQAGTEKGVVQFVPPTNFPVNRQVSTPSVNVPLQVTRVAQTVGGIPTLGVASANVIVMSGPCAPLGVMIPVTFPNGVQTVTLPANTITGSGSGACGIALSGGDTDPNQKSKFTSAFPNITVVPDPTPGPTPAPTPAPTAPPSGQCVNAAGVTVDVPGNIVMQPMFIGGSGNYVFDSSNYLNNGSATNPPSPGATGPMNTIQVFELPKTWRDGSQVRLAQPVFGDYVLVNNGASFEVAFSKCKGDFSYYKTPQASVTFPGGTQTFTPCGIVYGPNFSMAWGLQGDFLTCQVSATETWYMNWRVVPGTCPTGTGHTCGNVFSVPFN
jgi:hypothetical protein